MKTLTLISLLGFTSMGVSYAAISTANSLTTQEKPCLFGSNLVDMARYRDLIASKETTYDANHPIPAKLAKKYFEALGITNVNLADEAKKWYALRTITYKAKSSQPASTSKKYQLLLSDPGDNISGVILSGDEVVATVGDGDIGTCKVAFDPTSNQLFSSIKPLSPADEERVEGDYFGKNLAELERIAQFSIVPRQQDVHSTGDCYDDATCAAVQAAYQINDSLTKESYYLDVKDGTGVIVNGKAPFFVLARVKNGNILDATADFHMYDKLPWFYTN